MQFMNVGWETSLQNNGGQAVYGPWPAPVTIIGYQFDLSMCALNIPLFTSRYAMVLFTGSICATIPTAQFFGNQIVPVTCSKISGTNPLTFNYGPGRDSTFSAAILKTSDGSAVNKPIVLPPGSLPIAVVPQGNYIVFQAFHSGIMMDFEHQGELFFA